MPLFLAVVSPLESANAQDYQHLYESLESIEARSPERQVELTVKFKSIQREPAIVEMLEDSDLRLESLRWKYVGSGGGTIGAEGWFGNEPHKSVAEVFDDAELAHRLHYERSVPDGAPTVECPIDDAMAPVVDIDGKPGDPAIELACGIRVVEVRLSGPARAALAFVHEHSHIAEIHRLPSEEELKRALQILRGNSDDPRYKLITKPCV